MKINMEYNQLNNVSCAYQARNFIEKQMEKENMEMSNCINLNQLVKMVYENQKSSKRQFITTIIISVVTLIFAAISCYIGYIQLIK